MLHLDWTGSQASPLTHSPVLILAQEGNPSNQSLGGPVPAATQGGAIPNTPTAGTGTPAGTGPNAAPPPGFGFLWIIVAVFAFMIFMQWRTGKAEKKKRQELLDSVSKGDTVQLIGGEIGIVADIRETEVIIKFEEGKARYVKSAVQTVLRSTKAKDGAVATIETKETKKETANS
jgi:preprotein translocase YajC subunit